ncbi:hypothetical protein KC950_00785 [Candidatus Saccharibacteria bacterium]|uniref:Uncharacterized protein n=1 Tax=candidate division WWE3 bacterium TaxID=2053526 RepID=A0A955LVG5_UNCKA|nr:hypothetical protein [Candidatus Saccharibacteria bacterium]MCA9397382.1 hypothetical protein [candidate division WWE3 bacterium]
MQNCDNCVGGLKEQCDSLFRQESSLLALTQAWDRDEVAIAEGDARVLDHEVATLEEANQIESVHLADYRAEQLAPQLGELGFGLNQSEVREKLIGSHLGE